MIVEWGHVDPFFKTKEKHMDDNDWDKDLPVTIACIIGLVVVLLLVAIGRL